VSIPSVGKNIRTALARAGSSVRARLERIARGLAMSVAGIVTAWIAVYCLITIVALPSLKTSFYGSSPPSEIARLQRDVGVQATSGPTWIHLGWIADPRRERYRVLRADGQPTQWMPIAEPRLGSALLTGLTPESRYTLRVEAIERATSKPRIL